VFECEQVSEFAETQYSDGGADDEEGTAGEEVTRRGFGEVEMRV